MKRVILLGLILTVVIFLPRLMGRRPWETVRELWTRVTERGPATPVTPAPPPGPSIADRVGVLEVGAAQLRAALDVEEMAREDAVEALSRRVRSLTGLVATDRLRRLVDEGLFKVPAWQAPPASKLVPGDLPRYLKVGVGLVEATGEDVPSELGPLLAEVALFHLTESKVKSVRLYRETSEPPSPNLDLSLRLRYALTPTGGLSLHGTLLQIQGATTVWEGDAVGDDYGAVVRQVVTAAVGAGFGGRLGGGSE